jgi:hypothetical protein
MSPQYKDRNVLNYKDKNVLNYKNKNVFNYKDKISSIARAKLSSSYKDRNVLKYEDKSVLIVEGQKSCPHSCEDKNVLKVARTKYTQFTRTTMSSSYKDNNVLNYEDKIVLKLQGQKCPQIMRTKMSALIRSHDLCLILANKNRGFRRGYNLCI